MINTFFSWLIRFILRVITCANGFWLFGILIYLVIFPGLAELITLIFQPATFDELAAQPSYPVATCAIIWPYVKLLSLGDINCFPSGLRNLELVPFPAAVLLVLLDWLLIRFIETAGWVETYRENKREEEANIRYAEQRRAQELYEKERREASFRQAEIERKRAIEKAEAVRREHIENLILPDALADKQVELQTHKALLTNDYPFLEKDYHHFHPNRKHSTRRGTSLRRKANDPSQQNNQNQGEL
ncbi:MAG: hypothetical protein J0I20_32940 [Chloroflexi bacterium]|nr:hypothetical protein [Chloroflexota bacterium]OJV87027.1 MAG: hypothetical protein BGO39_33215 [Chloroflexi bacterium 54-19]